jgi:hypothetical protein
VPDAGMHDWIVAELAGNMAVTLDARPDMTGF